MTATVTAPVASETPPPPLLSPVRLLSLDALRGVVMFTMLFVNDVAGVAKAPWWMKHYAPPTASGMTFVDWVFGGFLFIVGVSIPHAFAARRARGDSTAKLLLHVLGRTASLLLLGVLMVNGDASAKTTFWPPHLWATLLYVFGIAAFLPWMIVRLIGFAGLAVLAITFRNDAGPVLQTKWWGILGLIGWAYLVASIVYLLARRSDVIFVVVLLLMGLWIFDRGGGFQGLSLRQRIDIGAGLGSHAAIALCGVVLGAATMRLKSHSHRLLFAVGWGVVLFAAAVAFGRFGINKNNATPAWCFICAGATAWLWVALAWLIEGRGIVRPLNLFIRGGSNVLLAYLLAPLWAHFLQLCGLTFYGRFGQISVIAGVTRSLLLAAVILWLAGVAKERGVRLKL